MHGGMSLQALLQQSDDAIAEADAAKLSKAAHSIKGQMRYMQATTATEAALALETEARALDDEQRTAAAGHTWSWECSARLAAMLATLRAEVERVDRNRRAVLAGL